MAVAAVGKDGIHASYSSTGSSVFVSAPGGDRESVSNSKLVPFSGRCSHFFAFLPQAVVLPSFAHIIKILSLNQAVAAMILGLELPSQRPLVS